MGSIGPAWALGSLRRSASLRGSALANRSRMPIGWARGRRRLGRGRRGAAGQDDMIALAARPGDAESMLIATSKPPWRAPTRSLL